MSGQPSTPQPLPEEDRVVIENPNAVAPASTSDARELRARGAKGGGVADAHYPPRQ